MISIVEFLKNWRKSAVDRKHIDSLFAMTPTTTTPLRKRLDWFGDLIQWVRSEGLLKSALDFSSGAPQAARVKYALLILQRNPEWKAQVAKTLRSIIQDAKALELYMTSGIPDQAGVFAEMLERLQTKFVPSAGNEQDLVSVFNQTFRFESDAIWIEHIDLTTFGSVIDLFLYDATSDFIVNNRLVSDAREALFLLAYQVSAMGLHNSIRHRASYKNFREIPFFQLPAVAEAFLETKDREKMMVNYAQLKPLIKKCQSMVEEVYTHMDEHGVGVELVYQLDRIQSSLDRMQILADLLCEPNPLQIQNFVAQMIQESVRGRSLSALMGDSLSLISRKISETSAETGEHYITRNRFEYYNMVQRALGGGLITAVTTLVKFLAYYLPFSPMFAGLVASLNYSISFIALQLMGFTLATKQPAMTASAMADQMNEVQDPTALEKLIDEIVNLIRSQVAAVFGNIVAVVPAMIVIAALSQLLFSHQLLNPAKAMHTLKDFSILGMTPIYAAFTGVLLFASSLAAGWVNNWFIYRRIPGAIAHDRRLVFTLGADNARKFSIFIRRNVAGFAGNISLGFFLGMTYPIMQFIGLPLDVRHVTLSSGTLTAAMMTLGADAFKHAPFWLAVGGVLSMGVLNLAVSFALAMTVAIRAKKVKSPQRRVIYSKLWQRLKTKPLAFILPPKEVEPKAPTAPLEVP